MGKKPPKPLDACCPGYPTGLLSHQGIPHTLLDHWFQHRFDLLTSDWQIEQLRRVSRYARVQDRLQTTLVGRFVNLLRDHALVLDELPLLDVSPDEDETTLSLLGLLVRRTTSWQGISGTCST